VDVLRELLADDALILDGLRQMAEDDGDRLFLYRGADGARTSYGDFDALVRRVANGLGGLGLEPGDRVSVLTRRAYTSVVTMFALWRGGFVYSPVNFNLHGDPLAYQLADTHPAAIVCEDGLLAALLPSIGRLDPRPALIVDGPEIDRADRAVAKVLTLDELVAAAASSEPQVNRTPHDVANLVYTSGTTGRPKGVLQPYRWMNQYTFLLRRMLSPEDTVYNDLPLYHIGGAIANVARAAWAGASVALWDKFSATEFWSRIEESGATLAILLDVMIPWLMSAEPREDDRRNTLNKVHMQPFPLYHREVAERFGIDFVLVGYGQTESGSVCAGLIDELAPGHGTPPELYRGRTRAELRTLFEACRLPLVPGTTPLRKGFMGREIPFVEVAVMGSDDEACRDGQVGELAVRPKLPSLLLREYFGRPEATVAATRNQWFHTGDIVTRSDDGYLYFVDRAGDRIRTRGENVSSLQVEDLLTGIPGVAMCAVLPVPAAEGLEHDIAAFVVAKDGIALVPAEVEAWATEHLPKFMRPRHVRVVRELPRTPTNKVEKYKLRSQLLEELSCH
jgi:crotonobetaine/carnitine-CoA ligase